MDLIGSLVRLRAPRPGDAEALVAIRSDPEVARFTSSPYFAPTRLDHVRESLRRRSPDDVRWIVERRSDRVPVGSSVLHRIDYRNRHCWFAIELSARAWQCGHGVEAIRLTTRFAFRQMGLTKVYVRAVEGDQRALVAYARAGYAVEAELKRHRMLVDRLVTELWLAAYSDDPAYAATRSPER